MSALNTLDTGGAEMFPGCSEAVTTVILALCGPRRNGTRDQERSRWQVFRDS